MCIQFFAWQIYSPTARSHGILSIYMAVLSLVTPTSIESSLEVASGGLTSSSHTTNLYIQTTAFISTHKCACTHTFWQDRVLEIMEKSWYPRLEAAIFFPLLLLSSFCGFTDLCFILGMTLTRGSTTILSIWKNIHSHLRKIYNCY